jgi:stage II sporulation protein AA (anti-sigma F factor antagonist)
MQSSFQVTEDILIAAAYGEIDHHTAGKLREEIDEAMLAFRCRHLVLDLKKVSFMDSSGIGVVLGRYNKVKRKNGTLYLTGCSDYIERILHMAGVFTVIEKLDSVEDAVWQLKGLRQLELEVGQ